MVYKPPTTPTATTVRRVSGQFLAKNRRCKRARVKLAADWRQLPLDALAATILQEQRGAVRKHRSEREWRRLDRMRKRLAELQKLAGHDPAQH